MAKESRRRAAAVVAAAGCSLLAPAVAVADNPPPTVPPGSAVSEYVEQVPTSTGSTAVRRGRRRGPVRAVAVPLSKPAQKDLARKGGRAKPVLQAIATQPGLGAQAPLPRTAQGARSAAAVASPSAVHAALDAGGGTSELLGGLAIAVVLVGAGLAVRLAKRS